jgi:hypothetical protein
MIVCNSRTKRGKEETISNYSKRGKKKYTIAERPRFMERLFTDRRKDQLNSYNLTYCTRLTGKMLVVCPAM